MVILKFCSRLWWSHSSSQLDAKMLWAACCLGFFAFFRAGKFTYNPRPEEVAPAMLTAQDIAVNNKSAPSFLTIFLHRSKTDQFGRGITLVVGRLYQAICPITAVLCYLAVRPAGRGPLFTYSNGTPLSRQGLVSEVRQALSVVGIDASSYAGHSFCIGAATAAASVGIPDSTIKMLGRWESSAFLRYIRIPQEQLIPISAQLLNPMQGTFP